MANDGDDGNDVDPLLLQYLISPRPPPLISSLEHNDVTISMAMKPSDFRNRLLFGSQGESSLSQNLSPSSSATTSFSGPAITNPIDHKTEQSDSKSIVTKAVALLILYLSFGVLIYWWNRDSYAVVHTHPIVDGLYFSIVTMCTIGYGDITPNSVVTKLFSILFVFVGFVVMCMFLSGYVINLQENKGRMRIRLKVGLALGLVVLCVGFGVLIMHFIEEIGWFDSFYYSVMSIML